MGIFVSFIFTVCGHEQAACYFVLFPPGNRNSAKLFFVGNKNATLGAGHAVGGGGQPENSADHEILTRHGGCLAVWRLGCRVVLINCFRNFDEDRILSVGCTGCGLTTELACTREGSKFESRCIEYSG